MFVFLRNSNHGWGSLAAPGTLHGATLDDVRCGTISLSDLLVNVPSATIATAVTYLTRLVENASALDRPRCRPNPSPSHAHSAEFTAFTDVVSAPATTDATHAVSMWSATGDTSQSYTVKVAETGEVPRRGPLPIPLSAVDPLETLRTCSSATSDAAVGELDWFMSTPATRAMLPSTTVGGFYRSVLFFDIAARASVGVTCNLETDVSVWVASAAWGAAASLTPLPPLYTARGNEESRGGFSHHRSACTVRGRGSPGRRSVG